jgi:hypothetical protein
MATLRPLEELYRRAVDLNLRYYASVAKLTVDYLRDLSSAVSSAQKTSADTSSQTASTASSATPKSATGQAATGAAPAIMVFEGEAGTSAVGVFLIGNSLAHEVTAPVTASPVIDEAGHTFNIAFSFDPAVINLRPGEQVLVRATALIDAGLEAGRRYRGELLIPELQGTRIPFIVRRRSADAGTIS